MQFHVGDTGTGPVNGTYSQNGGDGTAKITCTFGTNWACTLTTRDGTTVAYSGYNSSSAMSTITRPDGEVISLTYYTAVEFGNTVNKGVKTVSSSNGWILKYDRDGSYAVTQVTGYNRSVTCDDPGNSACVLPNGYPLAKKVVDGGETKIVRSAIGAAATDELTQARILSGGVVKTASGVTRTTTTYTTAEATAASVPALAGKVKTVQTGGSTWTYGYVFGSYSAITTTVTAPDATTRVTVVDDRGRIASQTDELGRQTKYEYDGAGRVLKVIAHDATYSGATLTGGYTEYRYDAQGNLDRTSTYPRNGGTAVVTSATYPGSGCTGKACRYPVETTDANNAVTTYTYDSTHGGVLSVIAPAPTSGANRIGTFYTYAQKTPRIKTSPTADTASTPVYRLVTTKTCAVQSSTSTACDVSGDTLWTQSTVSYDVDSGYAGVTRNVLPVKTVTTRGDNSVTLTSESLYTKEGQVFYSYGPKASDDASSDVTTRESFAFFDPIGRPVGGIGADPDGSARTMKRPATRTTYNSDGQVSVEESGVVPTSAYSGSTAIDRWTTAEAEWRSTTAGITVLDKNTNEFSTTTGLPIRARHYAALPVIPSTVEDAVTERSYDNRFRLTCEAQRLLAPSALAGLTSNSPNACAVTSPAGADGFDRITRYTYDAVGQVLTAQSGYGTPDARTDITNLYSDGTHTAPDSSFISKGALVSVTDTRGNKTAYGYDDFGRLKKTWYPSKTTPGSVSTSDVEETVYSGVRVQTQRLRDYGSNSASAVTFAYDDLGRVTGTTGAAVESFTYDAYSNVLTHNNQTTNGAEGKATYTYNAMGSVLTATYQLGTGTSRQVSYQYNSYNWRTRLGWPDGFYVNYTYYLGGALWYIRDNNSAYVLRDEYNQYGQQYAKRLGNVSPYAMTTALDYDTASRLNEFDTNLSTTAATTAYDVNVDFTYSLADQVKTQTRSNTAYNYNPPVAGGTAAYNGLNQVSTYNGATTFTYDNRGNLTSDGSATYSYNANNLLTSVVASSTTTTLSYDAENRLARIVKTGGAATTFLYDGVDLIAEYDDTGAMTARYIHGSNMDEPVVAFAGSGTAESDRRYLVADALGSIIAVTNSTGDIGAAGTGTNAYDEYGLPRSGNIGRFQYTGQVWLPEIGMYYYKARIYAPSLGRFLQPDPIGYGDGMNMYAYVHGDPVNAKDPMGLYGEGGEREIIRCDFDCRLRGEQTRDNREWLLNGNSSECSVAGTGCGFTYIGTTTVQSDDPFRLGTYHIGDDRVAHINGQHGVRPKYNDTKILYINGTTGVKSHGLKKGQFLPAYRTPAALKKLIAMAIKDGTYYINAAGGYTFVYDTKKIIGNSGEYTFRQKENGIFVKYDPVDQSIIEVVFDAGKNLITAYPQRIFSFGL
ncbi:wall-associated protein [Asticcacaulis biprosthecium C19]|uniref:Wall-associated protein n=2 Tax=Asticcacaulis biprosthecium TaxID=76891 RepID=F4QI00_9CAUL|nr:wall-associated protein [Asticcacaulis biprosthecium C19]